MKGIWQDMVSYLSIGENFVAATVFNKSGSAPRTAGAKMIIRADGSIKGTIGGGKLEGETRQLANQVFRSKQALIQGFNLTGTDAAQMDMICGGIGEVLLDYFEAADRTNLELLKGIVNAIDQREKAWLITGIGTASSNQKMRQRCLVKSDGTLLGQLACDEDFLQKLISGPAKISIHSEVLEDMRLLIEPIRSGGIVYIFGAGHVSQEIVPMAEKVGFKTVVVDDRREYACLERFPTSDIILLESFSESMPDLPIDRDSYLVIVTRGHLHDKTVLSQVLKKPAAYIGMIGSKRKRNMVYSSLKEEFGLEDKDFERVYSPIGLDILAESPEEIAVSIVAELIKVRAEMEHKSAISHNKVSCCSPIKERDERENASA